MRPARLGHAHRRRPRPRRHVRPPRDRLRHSTRRTPASVSSVRPGVRRRQTTSTTQLDVVEHQLDARPRSSTSLVVEHDAARARPPRPRSSTQHVARRPSTSTSSSHDDRRARRSQPTSPRRRRRRARAASTSTSSSTTRRSPTEHRRRTTPSTSSSHVDQHERRRAARRRPRQLDELEHVVHVGRARRRQHARRRPRRRRRCRSCLIQSTSLTLKDRSTTPADSNRRKIVVQVVHRRTMPDRTRSSMPVRAARPAIRRPAVAPAAAPIFQVYNSNGSGELVTRHAPGERLDGARRQRRHAARLQVQERVVDRRRSRASLIRGNLIRVRGGRSNWALHAERAVAGPDRRPRSRWAAAFRWCSRHAGQDVGQSAVDGVERHGIDSSLGARNTPAPASCPALAVCGARTAPSVSTPSAPPDAGATARDGAACARDRPSKGARRGAACRTPAASSARDEPREVRARADAHLARLLARPVRLQLAKKAVTFPFLDFARASTLRERVLPGGGPAEPAGGWRRPVCVPGRRCP